MNDFIIWNSKDTDYYNIEILNADVINTIKNIKYLNNKYERHIRKFKTNNLDVYNLIFAKIYHKDVLNLKQFLEDMKSISYKYSITRI